ncbi:3432_t:CDS:2 [Funneliformis mosseae]|uniref:3432_t:CDS:1 n=1 Tax=Funneliformis mosseae TaxID=27381 RepID=A0A9N9CFG3_FUNMO|nr:3432_t:CDS:2 [Funneliformis mosseae]
MSNFEETRVDYDEGTREVTNQIYPGTRVVYDEETRDEEANQTYPGYDGFLFRHREVVLSSSSNTSWQNLDHLYKAERKRLNAVIKEDEDKLREIAGRWSDIKKDLVDDNTYNPSRTLDKGKGKAVAVFSSDDAGPSTYSRSTLLFDHHEEYGISNLKIGEPELVEGVRTLNIAHPDLVRRPLVRVDRKPVRYYSPDQYGTGFPYTPLVPNITRENNFKRKC